jgi:hypothetical protein
METIFNLMPNDANGDLDNIAGRRMPRSVPRRAKRDRLQIVLNAIYGEREPPKWKRQVLRSGDADLLIRWRIGWRR